MTTSDHNIILTLTLRVEDDDKHTPCERASALLQHGTIRDAFADAGMTVLKFDAKEGELPTNDDCYDEGEYTSRRDPDREDFHSDG